MKTTHQVRGEVDGTYDEAVVALEEGEVLELVGVPNAQAVVLAGGQHERGVLVGLAVADGAPVALELSEALEVPGLELGRGVELEHLHLLGLTAEHEDVGGARVVADLAHAVDGVVVHVFNVLRGVDGAHDFLGGQAGHVEDALERAGHEVLLVLQEVHRHDAGLALLVDHQRLGRLAHVEQQDLAVGPARGHLVAVVGKNRVVALQHHE